MPERLPEKLNPVDQDWSEIKQRFERLGELAASAPYEGLQSFQKRVESALQHLDNYPMQDTSFEQICNELVRWYGDFFVQDDTYVIFQAPQIARAKLDSLFENHDVSDDLIALSMNLPSNPTAEMGRLMHRLASYPKVQECETGEAFAESLEEKRVSENLLKDYADFMNRFGFRTIKEIDIATPRPHEDDARFFDILKAIDIESDTVSKAEEKRRKVQVSSC